jgi:hypothetical protein
LRRCIVGRDLPVEGSHNDLVLWSGSSLRFLIASVIFRRNRTQAVPGHTISTTTRHWRIAAAGRHAATRQGDRDGQQSNAPRYHLTLRLKRSSTYGVDGVQTQDHKLPRLQLKCADRRNRSIVSRRQIRWSPESAPITKGAGRVPIAIVLVYRDPWRGRARTAHPDAIRKP